MDSPEDSNEADVLSPKMPERFVSEFKIDVNSKLTSNEHYELLKFLYKYKDIFARDFADIKTYEGFQLNLKPKNQHVKSYARQYKLRED